MELNIPGRERMTISHLLLDYNGTIALNGILLPSIPQKIKAINKIGFTVHLVTADTNGTVRNQCADLPIEIQIFDNSNVAEKKKALAEQLGANNCICIGNGFNDAQMFDVCSISIIIMSSEGCSVKSFLKADIACKDIEDAFDLILNPNRMIATLRG